MRFPSLFISLTICAALSACSSRTVAPTIVEAAKPALTPEVMQANLEEAGKLRPEHDFLKKMFGTWRAEVKFWMDPSMPPEVSKGSVVISPVFGGKFADVNYRGKWMGQNFQGKGIMGFNNSTNRYFSTWIDSTNTGIFVSEGAASADKSQVRLETTTMCPASREMVSMEDTYSILNKNHIRIESNQVRDGQKIKVMEINYTRGK